MKLFSGSRLAAFTMVEIMVSTAAFALAGGVIYEVLTNGIILSAKNSAVNLAHQQTRQAADRIIRDIHNAISVPVLMDVNRVALPNSVGPAPGIAFMLQSGPVLMVTATGTAPDDYSKDSTTIQVTGLGSFVPKVGQRFFIPTHQIEADIIAVNGSTLTLATSLGVPVHVTNSPANFNVVAYIADVVSYVMVSGELRFYGSASSSEYQVVARNQMNPQPFGLPFGATLP
jgi:type II secretory pathway pseudopilin PulG